MTSTKQRYVGYVRVSHVGARGGDSFHSPDDQARAIKDYCKRHNATVKVMPAELDESGGRLDRPILQEAISAVEAGRFDGIVFYNLSRLSRSTRDTIELYDRIEAAGAVAISVEENIDTSTANGRMHRNITASINQAQLENSRDNFDRLRQSSVERGIWQRRQTPLGYDRNPDTRKLEPNDDAWKVRAVFQHRAAGESVSSIARGIGYTTSGIRHILRNRVYLGELTVGAYTNAAAHPALVTLDQFNEVQRSQPRPARSANGEAALLGGLIRCAGCGYAMPRGGGGGKGDRRYAYKCNKNHSGFTCPAPAGITERIIDDYVEQIALDYAKQLTAQSRPGTDKTRDLRANLEAAETELAAYVTATSAAQIGVEIFTAGLQQRQSVVDVARENLEAERDRSTAVETVFAADDWQAMTITERNRVLRGLVEVVAVKSVGRGRKVSVADRAVVIGRGADVLPAVNGGEVPRGLNPITVNADHPFALRPAGT